MPGLLAHCLIASSTQFFIGYVSGLPILSWGGLLSGMVSVLMDLDSCSLPPGHSPLGHSVLLATAWCSLTGAAAFVLSSDCGQELATSVATGTITHLFLDMLTGAGIYLWPRKGYRGLFCTLGQDPRPLYFEHRRYLPVDEETYRLFRNGDASFPAWIRLGPPNNFTLGGARAEAALCAAGLLAIVVEVVCG